MLKAVLFDFDGTIVDSLHLHLQAWRKAFANRGKNLTDEEIIRGAFYSTDEQISKRFDIVDIKLLVEQYYSHMDELFKEFKLQENILNVLGQLKEKGVRIAIVSFADSDKLRVHLDRLGIASYFEFVLGLNDVTHPKPHPEIAEKAMKRLGAKPNETLLIGDTEMDIKTGKNARVLTALYIPQANKRYIDIEAYKKLDADFRFEHFSQLPSKISHLL